MRGLICDWVYKPGSVLTAIYLGLGLLPGSSRLLGTIGPILRSSTALLRIEFTALQCSHGAGALLPHLFTLAGFPKEIRWYLSVALVLRSPSAGVTRYPCPVEPGLSSSIPRWGYVRGCPTQSYGYFTLFVRECQISCKISLENVYYTYGFLIGGFHHAKSI